MQSFTLLHVITGLGNGGAEGVLFRLCQADASGATRTVVVSLTGPGTYGEPLQRAGVEVHCLSMQRNWNALAALPTLYRLIKKIRPDVVQTWMYHADLVGGLMARLAGVRSVVWNIRHSDLDFRHNSWSTLIIARACALLSRTVPAKIISCSSVATSLHKRIGYDRRKFVDIPNGYRLDKLVPCSHARCRTREGLGVTPSDFVIGMVARFHAQKDHRNLLAALSRVRNAGRGFKCILVGPDITTSNRELFKIICDANLQDLVSLVGPRSDISDLMNSFDLHVLSSSMGEGFPNVLAEAMACGTPCVTTDVGDARLIVGNAGWVVAPKDAEALGNAIILAMREKADRVTEWRGRREMCRSRIVDKFDVDAMARSYACVWRLLLNGNK